MEYSNLLQKKNALSKSLYSASGNTIYENKFSIIMGTYKVYWKEGEKEHSHSASLRFTDFEGYRPKLSSFKYILPAVTSYLESRKSYIIKDPKPFIVYEAITYLQNILKPGAKVLEFGSGNSTLWFLSQKAYVTSVEHHKDWYNTVNERAKSGNFPKDVMDNFDYKNIHTDTTWKMLEDTPDETYDLIFVDGTNDYANRNICIDKSLAKLKKGGWMVLDNSDHPNNWPGGLYLDTLFERVRFTGFTTMGLYVSQTSFWKKI